MIAIAPTGDVGNVPGGKHHRMGSCISQCGCGHGPVDSRNGEVGRSAQALGHKFGLFLGVIPGVTSIESVTFGSTKVISRSGGEDFSGWVIFWL